MKVTVITPVLNGCNTIEDCITSVQRQDYFNVEHIIIDGGSTDDTLTILDDSDVTYFSGKDAGIYDAFNRGLAKASGDVIHILNADDFYADNRVISTAVTAMTDTGCDLLHGLVELVDESNQTIKTVGKNIDKRELLNKMRVAHPSVFVRSTVYQKYGNFSVGFKIAGDHEFLLRVWDKIQISFLPTVFVNMRLGGVSSGQYKKSYRESFAAALLHGATPTRAFTRYCWEVLKIKMMPGK